MAPRRKPLSDQAHVLNSPPRRRRARARQGEAAKPAGDVDQLLGSVDAFVDQASTGGQAKAEAQARPAKGQQGEHQTDGAHLVGPRALRSKDVNRPDTRSRAPDLLKHVIRSRPTPSASSSTPRPSPAAEPKPARPSESPQSVLDRPLSLPSSVGQDACVDVPRPPNADLPSPGRSATSSLEYVHVSSRGSSAIGKHDIDPPQSFIVRLLSDTPQPPSPRSSAPSPAPEEEGDVATPEDDFGFYKADRAVADLRRAGLVQPQAVPPSRHVNARVNVPPASEDADVEDRVSEASSSSSLPTVRAGAVGATVDDIYDDPPNGALRSRRTAKKRPHNPPESEQRSEHEREPDQPVKSKRRDLGTGQSSKAYKTDDLVKLLPKRRKAPRDEAADQIDDEATDRSKKASTFVRIHVAQAKLTPVSRHAARKEQPSKKPARKSSSTDEDIREQRRSRKAYFEELEGRAFVEEVVW